MAFNAVETHPLPSAEYLKAAFVGTSLHDAPTPSAVIDLPTIQLNCRLMLEAVKSLAVSFRAHVKTHKTREITQLQVGQDCRDVRLIVSTIIEAEQLLPLLLEYQDKSARVNVLYGVPPGPAAVTRLAQLARRLGEGSISFMIDHPRQLVTLKTFVVTTGFAPSIFIKADSGTHRAGLSPDSSQMATLVQEAARLDSEGGLILHGFYSHAGHSYSGKSPTDAMDMLAHEISICKEAAQHCRRPRSTPLTLSVGASPTVLSVQNLSTNDSSTASQSRPSLLSSLQTHSTQFTLELHAGVYPLMDMQQLATHARDLSSSTSPPTSVIALTILSEITSLYPHRLPSPEALIAAGTLALAREPCPGYSGWGVVSDWNIDHPISNTENRLVISRLSQEHGIVASGTRDSNEQLPLSYGQKIRIYPNHACITSAMYSYYFVVDSSSTKPDEIVDVWVRWRGW